jgi:hypothetical protein
VRIIAQSDGCGIRRNRAERAEWDRQRPGETIYGFRVSELGIIGDDHHIALQHAVEVDVEIARKWRVAIEIGGSSADCRLKMPATFIKFLEGDGVLRRWSECRI